MERTGRIERPQRVRRNLGVAAKWLLIAAFGGLGVALFRIQVVNSEHYTLGCGC